MNVPTFIIVTKKYAPLHYYFTLETCASGNPWLLTYILKIWFSYNYFLHARFCQCGFLSPQTHRALAEAAASSLPPCRLARVDGLLGFFLRRNKNTHEPTRLFWSFSLASFKIKHFYLEVEPKVWVCCWFWIFFSFSFNPADVCAYLLCCEMTRDITEKAADIVAAEPKCRQRGAAVWSLKPVNKKCY